MNDNEYNQILRGDRCKLLDCHRRAWLRHLHGANMNVWLSVFTSENDGQQAWLSLEQLEYDTGYSSHSVIDAKRWLVDHGWVVVLEGTAADKYSKPTQGAHKVQVIRVDDPTKGCKTCCPDDKTATLPYCKNCSAEIAVQKLPATIADKGSGVVLVSCNPIQSYIDIIPSDMPVSEPVDLSLLRKGKATTKTKAKTLTSAVKWLEKYGEPKPVEFDTWSQATRSEWVYLHDPANREAIQRARDRGKPLPFDPPPPPKWKCPACEFGHKYGYAVAEHIEQNHLELGQQSFEITCTEAGCHWHTWWNTITNNKAAKEVELINHLEEHKK